MRKLLLSFLLLIVAVCLYLPFQAGITAKKKLTHLVNDFSKKTAMQFELKDYKRGWFKSTANLVLTVKDDIAQLNFGAFKLPPGGFVLVAKEKITHGPFVFDTGLLPRFGYALVQGDIALPEELKANLKFLFPNEASIPTLHHKIFLRFGGGVDLNLQFPALKINQPGLGEYEWGGFNLNYRLTSGFKEMSGLLNIAELSVTTPLLKVKQDSLEFEFNGVKKEGLWIGESNFTYPKLIVVVDSKQKVLVTGLKMNSENDISGQLFDASLEVDLDKFQFEDQSYGPGQLKVVIRKLDVPTILKIKEQSEVASDPALSDEQRQLMLMSVLPLLPRLVDQGGELKKTFELKTPEGRVFGDANVVFGKSDAASKPAAGEGVMALLKRLDATANVEFPKALLERILKKIVIERLNKQQLVQTMVTQHQQKTNPKLVSGQTQATTLTPAQIETSAAEQVKKELASMLADKFIVEEGDLYKINIQFKNSQLMINGKSMSEQGKSINSAGPVTKEAVSQ